MNIYTEKQLVSHYRYLSDESKKRITKIIASFCTIEKVERRSERAAEEIRAADKEVEDELAKKKLLRCTFCGKLQTLCDRLIAGNGAYICDECVRMAKEIVDDPSIKPEGEES